MAHCPECGGKLILAADFDIEIILECEQACWGKLLNDLPSIDSAIQYTIDQINQIYLEPTSTQTDPQ